MFAVYNAFDDEDLFIKWSSSWNRIQYLLILFLQHKILFEMEKPVQHNLSSEYQK